MAQRCYPLSPSFTFITSLGAYMNLLLPATPEKVKVSLIEGQADKTLRKLMYALLIPQTFEVHRGEIMNLRGAGREGLEHG